MLVRSPIWFLARYVASRICVDLWLKRHLQSFGKFATDDNSFSPPSVLVLTQNLHSME